MRETPQQLIVSGWLVPVIGLTVHLYDPPFSERPLPFAVGYKRGVKVTARWIPILGVLLVLLGVIGGVT